MIFSKSLATMMVLAISFASASILSDHPADMSSIFTDEEIKAGMELMDAEASEQGDQRNLRYRSRRSYTINVDLNVTNLSFQQPFGQFFVMVHNHKVDPLFTLGVKSSEGLQELAENGSPAKLVEMYEDDSNVSFAKAMGNGPLFGGGMTTLTVPVTYGYHYVTIASMAIHTNDCFVALNSQRLFIGAFNSPGYDSGTEENNELCSSIPGPACGGSSGNVASGKGEGFVHVHRGFFGIGGDLSEAGYDWRNPMMRVEVGRSMKPVMQQMKKMDMRAKKTRHGKK